MRIVVAHDSIDTDGGVETYLVAVIAEMRRRGHQVALLYQHGGHRHSPLGSSADLALGIADLGLPDAMAQLREWQPAVCFSHNMAQLAVDRTLLDAWPVVKMLHGFFGTCISGLKMHAFPSETACSRTFGTACLGLYLPRRCGRVSLSAMVSGFQWATAQRDLFPRYAAIVLASRFMRDEVAGHGVPADRATVVPLFPTMTIDRNAPAPEPDTVVFAGRMTTLKGGHVLIAAAARASTQLGRPVRLVMAGEGPQKEAWRQLAAARGVEADFTGWVANDHRAGIYCRGAVAVVPSLWPEPFGLAGLDVGALGRPAVAFDVGGIREWLADGVNGRLVAPAAGERGLAGAIAALLAESAERERMARGALDVASRMSVAAHVDGLESVFGGVAA